MDIISYLDELNKKILKLNQKAQEIQEKERMEYEERFINQGDILHPLGVIQAVHLCNEELSKEKFRDLVRKNYRIPILNDRKIRKTNTSWNEARKRLRMMGC